MKKKIAIIAGAAAIIVLIIVLNLIHRDQGKNVEIAVVEKGELVTRVSAAGELKAKSQVDITAELIARVKSLHYQEGDYVKAGALIIQFDDVQAGANFRLAEARLNQARQDFDRIKVLFEKNLISRGDFEQAQLNFQVTQAQYDQALDTYQKTRIYAPISGRIMKLNIEEGETAMMGTMNFEGTVLATIADLSRMIAIVKIDETDIPAVKAGQPVEITADARPDSIYRGKVVKVGLMPLSTQLSTDRTTDFEVEIEMDEFSPDLRPGMNVNASITTNRLDSVIVVPVQAIGSRKMNDTLTQTIFTISRGKAELKKVIIGVSNDTKSEIISGLSAGDTVISGPYRVLSKLKDGERVQFKKRADGDEQASPAMKAGGAS